MAELDSSKSRFCRAEVPVPVQEVIEAVPETDSGVDSGADSATKRQEVSTDSSDIPGIVYQERLKEMGDRFAALKEKHPEFKKKPYLVLCKNGDPEIDSFLEDCSLSVLHDLKILYINKRSFPRLDIVGRWEEYAKKVPEREDYRCTVIGAPSEEISLYSLYYGVVSGIETMSHVVDNSSKLGSMFDQYLDPKAILSIYINEIAPYGVEGERYSRKARVELYRMFLEAGFQIQKVPAVYDKSGVSYGLDQETLDTHNGLMGKYGKDVNGVINPDFSEQVNVDQQIRRSLLLAYENLVMFEDFILVKIKKEKKTVSDLEIEIKKTDEKISVLEKKDGKNRKELLKKRAELEVKLAATRKNMYFGDFYEMLCVSATDDEKRKFVATMIAAFHNNGNGGVVKNIVTQMVLSRPGTLTEARSKFLDLLKGRSVGGLYTRSTHGLYESIEGVYIYDCLSPIDFGAETSDRRRPFRTLEEMGF